MLIQEYCGYKYGGKKEVHNVADELSRMQSLYLSRLDFPAFLHNSYHKIFCLENFTVENHRSKEKLIWIEETLTQIFGHFIDLLKFMGFIWQQIWKVLKIFYSHTLEQFYLQLL